MAGAPGAASELTGFEQVIRNALSEDGGLRKQAEATLEQGLQTPDRFFGLLLQLLQASQNLEVRAFCGVMLRQYMRRSNDIWSKLSPQSQHTMKEAVLQLWGTEPNESIRNNCAHVLGVLASKVVDAKTPNAWPSLLPAMFTMAQSKNKAQLLSVLSLFQVMAEFSLEALMPVLPQVYQALMSCMKQKLHVSLAALQAMSALLIALDDDQKRPMVDSIPAMFQIVIGAYKLQDYETLLDALSAVAELVHCEPKFVRPHLESVISTCGTIVKQGQLAPEARRMAMEVLLTLSERGGGMVRKSPTFAQTSISLAFVLMLELKHTPAWDTAADEADLEQENYQMGVESVDRLATTLGGKIFRNTANPMLQQFIKAPSWLHRHAALMCVSEMAEGCKKVMENDLQNVVSLVLPFLNKQEHPRVQWAAINALAQIATDFNPEFQNQFHPQVVPALIAAMDLQNNPRVVRSAACCIVDFGAGVDVAVLEPYTTQLMQVLCKLLQANQLKMQEACLMAVSAVAAVVGPGIAPFYSSFMPACKAILSAPERDEIRDLRGKAMECMGLLAKAIGAERFAPEAGPIMNMLQAIRAKGFKADDTQLPHLLQAQARMCECLGPLSAPYLSVLIPPLLASAAIEGACVITDVEEDAPEPEAKEGIDHVRIDLRGIGCRLITINTAATEEKIAACEMLLQYVKIAKEAFFPYVTKTAQILAPLVGFPLEGVKNTVMLTMPILVKCASLHFKKLGADGRPMMAELFTFMFPHFCVALQAEAHVDILCALDCIGDSVENLAMPLPKEQIEALHVMLANVVQKSQIRRQERAKQAKHPDFDEEEQMALEEKNQEEDDFLTYVFSCCQQMVKACGPAYLPTFHTLLYPMFLQFTASGNTGQVQAGMCIINDAIRWGGEGARQYVDQVLPHVFRHCQHPDETIVHSAVYGVGICASAVGRAFKPARDTALQTLMACAANEKFYQPARDNAISSIGRICEFCFEKGEEPKFQGQSLWPIWLSSLPIQADEDEAQDVNAQLVRMVQTQNPWVLGKNNSALPKIVAVLLSALGTPCSKPALDMQIVQLIMALKTQMPAQVWATLAASLAPELQQKVAQVERSVASG